MAATDSRSEPFIVVVLGCTGTGKSKLAIEIGKEIGGEIISADSMQVYKGLDIITNKVTQEEQAMIPHHMIDLVEANEKFSVVEFKRTALPIISDIFKRQKVPIIVGGTNYYIESLLWENLIEETTRRKTSERSEGSEDFTTSQEIQNAQQMENERENPEHGNLEHERSEHENSEHANLEHDNSEHANSEHENFEHANSKHENFEHANSKHENPEHENLGHANPEHENPESQDHLYQKLVEIDAAMAHKLHPNDTRKITRSLQVYEHCGITHSELIVQQQAQEGATVYGGPMRFKNVCVLWLQCDLKTLDRRLDERVDKMIEQGLVEELLEFHNSWRTHSPNTEGIFQSIGFKEFHDFLRLENPLAEKNGALFQKCVDAMKSATRRYARKQIKWVANRFLGRPSTCAPDVYGLEATDLEQWESCVLEKGLKTARELMEGRKVAEQPLSRVDPNAASKRSRHTCEVCNDRTIIGDKNWTAHQRSRSHRHYMRKAKNNETKT